QVVEVLDRGPLAARAPVAAQVDRPGRDPLRREQPADPLVPPAVLRVAVHDDEVGDRLALGLPPADEPLAVVEPDELGLAGRDPGLCLAHRILTVRPQRAAVEVAAGSLAATARRPSLSPSARTACASSGSSPGASP